MDVIYSKLGEELTFILYVYDAGTLVDSLTTPQIKNIYLPDLSVVDGYPQDMTHFDTGMYYFKYKIPVHPSSVGNIIVDIEYQHPDTRILNKLYQVITRHNMGIANRNYVIVKN